MKRQELWKLLDFYKRKEFLKNELKEKFLTNIDSNISLVEKTAVLFKKNKIRKIGSKSRINNKCVITGRNYNVNTYFNISRFKLKDSLKRNQVSLVYKK